MNFCLCAGAKIAIIFCAAFTLSFYMFYQLGDKLFGKIFHCWDDNYYNYDDGYCLDVRNKETMIVSSIVACTSALICCVCIIKGENRELENRIRARENQENANNAEEIRMIEL